MQTRCSGFILNVKISEPFQHNLAKSYIINEQKQVERDIFVDGLNLATSVH